MSAYREPARPTEPEPERRGRDVFDTCSVIVTAGTVVTVAMCIGATIDGQAWTWVFVVPWAWTILGAQWMRL